MGNFKIGELASAAGVGRDTIRYYERMGLQTPHDHREMKGQGRNPMNLSHDQCLRILRNAE